MATRFIMLLVCCVVMPLLLAGDWNQWRGAGRDGVDRTSPRLIDQLPADGLKPAWVSEEIPSGGNGGWGSPVVAGGKVYLFAHYQTDKPNVQLPPPRFQGVTEEQRTMMSKEELDAYEQHRHEEERARRRMSHDVTETVYCLDAPTGETLWKQAKPSAFTSTFHSGTPAVVEGRVYVLGTRATARCLDAESGQPLWETPLQAGDDEQCFMSSICVAEGVAVVLAGRLFGLDAETGSLLWQGEPGRTSGSHSSPVVWNSGGREFVIVNVAGQDTICVDPRDGRELWRAKSEANLSTPVVVGDRLLTYGDSRKKGLRCFMLAPDAAELLWTCQRVADKGSSPVVVDGHVYLQGEKRLACVDLQTGEDSWTAELDLHNPQYTSLIAADGKVFYASGGVVWFSADPSEYRLLAEGRIGRNRLLGSLDSFRRLLKLDESPQTSGSSEQAQRQLDDYTGGQGPLECASPAIADGRLYLRLNRALACYDVRDRGHLAQE